MDIRKFVIGLIVGIFVAAGIWYALNAPTISKVLPEERGASTSVPTLTPSTAPGEASGYGPKTPPYVTPPTTPPPSGAESSYPATSGIRGSVSIGPICPVVPADDPEGKCADRPFAANFRVRNLFGAVVTEFSSNDDGTFSVSLPAGTYAVEQMPGALYPRISSPTQSIVVKKGLFTSITIEFDTGIR